MNKTEMKTVAKSVFDRYTTAEKVFITSDGQVFFDEVHARNHQAKNRTGKELALEAFRRDDVAEKASAAPKSAEVLSAEVAEAATVDAVQEISDTEKAGKNRKTVLDACEKKIAELKAQ